MELSFLIFLFLLLIVVIVFVVFLQKRNKFLKAYSDLKKNDLIPQAMLLKQAKDSGYSHSLWKNGKMSEEHRDFEIKMLVTQKVNILAASNSISRFKKAQNICNKYGLEDGSKLFQEYVNLYNYYIKNYHDLGGPTSW